MTVHHATLEEILASVWRQVFEGANTEVEIQGARFPIACTRGKGFRIVEFSFDGRTVTGIEQNPKTSSSWAVLAREGQRIMQFSCEGRYFANVAEGKVTRYAGWKSLGLPE